MTLPEAEPASMMTSIIKSFSIKLTINDNDSGIVHGTTKISGLLLLDASESIIIHELSVSLTGEAKTKMMVKKSDKQSLTDHVLYLEDTWKLIAVVGSLESGRTKGRTHKAVFKGTAGVQLAEGQHEAPFSRDLPPGIPGSCQPGRYGGCRYNVGAKIVLSRQKSEIDSPLTFFCRRGITVVETVDLNRLASRFITPDTVHLSKKVGVLPCTSKEVNFSISLPRQAYVAGECIQITGLLDNGLARRVEKATVSLQMITDFSTKHQVQKSDVQSVVEETLALYIDAGSRTRIDRFVALPALTPSTPMAEYYRDGTGGSALPRSSITNLLSSSQFIKYRRLLKVSYELVIKLIVSSQCTEEVRLPIIIGTEPLVERPRTTLLKQDMVNGRNRPMSLCVESTKRDNEVTGDGLMYRQPRSEKQMEISKPGEAYLSNRARVHVNYFPFYTNLNTSSKQSRKMSTALNVIKAEQMLKTGHYIAKTSNNLSAVKP